MGVAFAELEHLNAAAAAPAEEPSPDRPRIPASAADLTQRPEAFLAAVCAQTGLDAPTDLQARTDGTFVGH